MRSVTSCVATLLALGLAAPATAQDDPLAAAWDGIQSSLGELYHGAVETWDAAWEVAGPMYREAVRRRMLVDEDIHMTMLEADPGTTGGALGDGVESLTPAWWVEAGGGSIYAEFDWDNRATSMRLMDEGSKTTAALVDYEGEGLRLLEYEQDETDVTIYFDATGGVWVPIRETVGGTRYTRVSLPGLFGHMVSLLEVSIDQAIDARVTDMVDALGTYAAIRLDPYGRIFGTRGSSPPTRRFGGVMGLLQDYALGVEYDEESGEWLYEGVTESMVEDLADHVRERFEFLSVFPPLIHFAFFFSPAAIRSHLAGRVHEDTGITWQGRTHHGRIVCVDCTRFTVEEGEQRGYIMIFDRFGRLVHLRDTDGSTATYGYDRELTVP